MRMMWRRMEFGRANGCNSWFFFLFFEGTLFVYVFFLFLWASDCLIEKQNSDHVHSLFGNLEPKEER